ncbi:MAG: hypothetical protein JOS17DRAFT_756843 [Linnemannia elongata]|nr:MAG: hypothetical protein JOS17DRAFT_756843 [Linnemannia elongata]
MCMRRLLLVCICLAFFPCPVRCNFSFAPLVSPFSRSLCLLLCLCPSLCLYCVSANLKGAKPRGCCMVLTSIWGTNPNEIRCDRE